MCDMNIETARTNFNKIVNKFLGTAVKYIDPFTNNEKNIAFLKLREGFDFDGWIMHQMEQFQSLPKFKDCYELTFVGKDKHNIEKAFTLFIKKDALFNNAVKFKCNYEFVFDSVICFVEDEGLGAKVLEEI